MTTETALPPAQEAPASGQPNDADQLAAQTANEGAEGHADASSETEGQGEKKPKPEKTPEERERDRLRKAIDRRTRREAEWRAKAEHLEQELSRYREAPNRATNHPEQDDEEPLTLSRAELAKMVKSEAEKLAPTLKQQQAEIEHRTKVVESLAKDYGAEFDAVAEDLDEALGGLQRNGKPTPAAEALFAADDPKAVIEYLRDPENADEAEAIGRMDAVRAGRAIAKLEARLEQAKAQAKPQRSKAPEPVEPAKGGGVISDMPNPADTKAYIKWANEQERRK